MLQLSRYLSININRLFRRLTWSPEYLPHNKEAVSIKVPTLDYVLAIFKNYLNEGSVVSTQNCCVKIYTSAGGSI